MPHRTIIGLTGNIATGKSAVMRMAAAQGAFTLDADGVVHGLLEGDETIQQAVIAEFGPDVGRTDGRIDRPALGGIVFNDPAALARLEAILHPAVRLEIARSVNETTSDVVMIEAIKLLEGPLAEACDQIWVTTCPMPVQMERLRVCRGLDEREARARIDAQPPQAEKIARADVVINTDGPMRETQAQFDTAWATVQTLVSAD